jgi:hypothetical protein
VAPLTSFVQLSSVPQEMSSKIKDMQEQLAKAEETLEVRSAAMLTFLWLQHIWDACSAQQCLVSHRKPLTDTCLGGMGVL